MTKRFKRIFSIASTVLLAVILYFTYSQWVSPTAIGLINYPDYMFAELDDANSNSFIKIERVNWKEDEQVNLKSFSAVYIFGMGLRLPPERMQALQDAIKDGLPVYVSSATSQKANITSITGNNLEYVQTYLGNRSKTNFKRLLNYTRREIDGKKIFSDPIQKPVIIPHDGFFHIGENAIFKTLEEYEAFRKKNNLYYPNGPKVCFLTSTAGSSSEHITALVDSFEKAKINIYPIFGFRKRLDFIKEVSPGVVTLMPHGRFTTQKENEVIDYLKEQNIPLICPIKVHEPHSEWLKDQRGMAGGIMSQSVTMPELDGGIMPFVLSAQFKNERDLYVFKALPKRINRFVQTVKNYLDLKQKANQDKKLVIIYYKGPGQNALLAAGLEVGPSLYNTLKNLEKAGYNTGELPKDSAELEAQIQARATNFNPYAKGSIQKFVEDPSTLLVPVPDFLNWVKDAMPDDLYSEVEKRYGKAPGSFMSINKNGVDNIALASLQYGNIVLMPQSLPGFGSDTNKLIHGAKHAPPYPYIATYLWAKYGYETDAIMHFGTHGSFEFTPWKQVALSSYDWADVLIGDMPHFYIYTINNIGEAIIAKRRGYAALISHLTPPFMSSDLYDDLTKIHDNIHVFTNPDTNTLLRKQYEDSIIELVKKKKMDRELGIKNLTSLHEDNLLKIHNYIHELESAKVNRGLYVLDRKYSDSEAAETARLMAVDAIAISLADIDVIKGKITLAQKANAHHYDVFYLSPAHKVIDALLKGEKPENFIDKEDLENFKASNSSDNKVADEEQKQESVLTTAEEQQLLRQLLFEIGKTAERFEFIKSLQDIKIFQQVSSLTSRHNLSKARRTAELMPKLKKMIELATAPDMMKMIKMVQKPQLKTHLFELLTNQDIENKIVMAQQKQIKSEIAMALSKPYTDALYLTLNPKLESILEAKNIKDMTNLRNKITELEKLKERLLFLRKMQTSHELIAESEEKHAKNVAKILETSTKSLDEAIVKCSRAIKQASQRYSDYLHALKAAFEAMNSVVEYKNALLSSTDAEVASLINALNGGYIPPSAGADPIRNPNSIPTGRNLFSIDTESTPTKEAWKTAVKLGKALIESKLKAKGEYPKKVAFTLWGGEFIRSHGTNIAEILYMLGVEPVWSPRGRVKDVKLIPIEKLKRPRIDVFVQTSGQFRGAATSRLYLIDKAVRMAATADDGDKYKNNVKQGTLDAERVMIAKGYSPLEARKLATARIFGGVNGNFGSGIMGLVESGDKWEKEEEIADQYMKNMGAIYTRDNWCDFKEGVFEAAVQNTDTVVQPRSSNTSGPLSLDHVYEFMGGINLAVKKVTGNTPDAYFNDLRNPNSARIQTAKEAAMVEARTTILNPKFIEEMMQEGASAAESFAEATRNSYGWEVMRPEMLEDYYWEDFKATIIDDKYKLGTKEFFEKKNPYALQEMTAVMLETIRKGYWKADAKTQKELAELHAKLVEKYNAGCSGFVCDNKKLQELIGDLLEDKKVKQQYQKNINKVRTVSASKSKQEKIEGMELKKVKPEKKKVQELLKENAAALITIATIILLLIISVVIGSKKRKEA